MNQVTPESLELGLSLRESTNLINCRAIIEYSDGSTSHYFSAVIPPGGINSEGYVEEVWIDARLQEYEVDGSKHQIINPPPIPIVTSSECWIDRFEWFPNKPLLRPSSEIDVKFRITT